MMTQFTLLTTLALHHLIIGGSLIVILTLLNKLVKTNAEMRSWIWLTAFLIATLIPFSLLTSDSRFQSQAVPQNTTDEQVTKVKKGNVDDVIINQQIITNANKSSARDWHVPSDIIFGFKELLTFFLLIWFCGSLWRTYSVLQAYIYSRGLAASCKPMTSEYTAGGNIAITLWTSDSVSSPMVIGLMSPKIILPENIVNNLSEDKLAPIILHEQAHIQRNDTWFGVLQELIAIIFWWSPVIRILNKKIHIDRELACDLRAAKQLDSGKQYAQSLVDCAKLMLTQQRSILAMGLFSQKKELSYRINEVLKNNSRKTPSIFLTAIACFGLAFTTVNAAQQFAPQISINDVQSDSKHYSLLSQRDGERLIEAVRYNDVKEIERLIAEGVDIDTPAIGDGTALIMAVKRDNQAMVQALIDLGADVNQSSRGDGNPLIAAASANNLPLGRLLLENGADVNGIVIHDETPLINATRRGYLEMSQFLVNSGADVNLAVRTGMSDGFVLRSPLNMARTSEVRDFLIENGATD